MTIPARRLRSSLYFVGFQIVTVALYPADLVWLPARMTHHSAELASASALLVWFNFYRTCIILC